MISGTHLEPKLPRRIRDTYTGEVFWFSKRDRSYHDQADRHSYPPSRFLNYAGQLAAYYEEVPNAA